MSILRKSGTGPRATRPTAGASTRSGFKPGDASTHLVGLVLAGGRSRRMGRDKALLPWGEGTLVAHAAARLAAVAAEVLVADAGRGYLPPPYLSVEDGPGAGPAAGLLGAARARPDHRLLVLACDLPQVPTALLERLLAAAQGADLTLPRTTRGLEPLCAVYGPRALEGLAERVAAGRFDLQGLAGEPGLEVRELRGEDLDAWLVNLNRPEDLPG